MGGGGICSRANQKEVKHCERRKLNHNWKQAGFRCPNSSSCFPGHSHAVAQGQAFPQDHPPVPPGLSPHALLSAPSWHAIIVDGHSVEELCKAFGQVKNQPTAIIAKTFKGRGITGPYVPAFLPTPTRLVPCG